MAPVFPFNPIVIVGSGLAGLCAALECIHHGSNVIVIEKSNSLGGVSKMAKTGINGILNEDLNNESLLEFRKFLKDSATLNDTVSISEYSESLLDVLASNSNDAINWLISNFKLSLKKTKKFLLVPSSPDIAIGKLLIELLSKKLISLCELNPDKYMVLNNCELIDFLKDNNGINEGIICKYKNNKIVFKKPVILTTGGELSITRILQNRPDLSKFCIAYPENSKSSFSALSQLEKESVTLTNLKDYQLVPNGLIPFESSSFTSVDNVVPVLPFDIFDFGIIINSSGKIIPSDTINLPIEMSKQSPLFSYLLLPTPHPVIRKIYHKVLNSKELLDFFGWSKLPLQLPKSPNYTLLKIVPTILISLGGVKVDVGTMEIDNLKDFFASGELVGGIHGHKMVIGSSLLSCIVTSRIASKNACISQLKKLSNNNLATNNSRAFKRLHQLKNHFEADKIFESTVIPRKEFTLTEISNHNKSTDCWIILKNVVLDVTKFVMTHPGGASVLLMNTGGDITDNFEMFHDDSVVLKARNDIVILGRVKGLIIEIIDVANMGTCIGVTTKGVRCKIKLSEDKKYCHYHEKQGIGAGAENVKLNGSRKNRNESKNSNSNGKTEKKQLQPACFKPGFIYTFTLFHLLDSKPEKQPWLHLAEPTNNNWIDYNRTSIFDPRDDILIKIGFTTQPVQKRINQWREQCQQGYVLLKPGSDVKAVKTLTKIFRKLKISETIKIKRKLNYQHLDESGCWFVSERAYETEQKIHAELRNKFGFGKLYCHGCGDHNKSGVHVEWFLVPRKNLETVWRVIDNNCV